MKDFAVFGSLCGLRDLLYREEEQEMMPLCAAEGVGVLPWSPQARGRLTLDWGETSNRMETDEFGKTLYAATGDADRGIVERLAEIAAKRGVLRAQVALAWVTQKPFVTAPIVGASKPDHPDDAIASLSLNLTSEEISSLEEPYAAHPVVGF